MLKYSYLCINIFCVLGPVLLSFDKKVHFYTKWKFIFPGLIITGLLFLVWDIIFTKKGVWSFDKSYITGVQFFGLPLEEILFFITVPFACLFIYECLNCYFPNQKFTAYSRILSGLISIISLSIGIYHYQKVYTFVNFTSLGILLVIFFNYKKNYFFFRAYLLCLIPFYMVNGILTSIPIVNYNNHQNLGIRIGCIPLEDHFYLMSLLLLNVFFFEKFKTMA